MTDTASDTLGGTVSDPLAGGAVERRPDPLTDPLPQHRGGRADDTPTSEVPVTPEALTSAPRVDPPPSAAAVPITQRRESITCPECGTVAQVQLTRREAGDFCAKCDFPLFWTPATIQLGEGATDGAALRRLPGTGGKQTVASTACPHCREANPITADTCGRCGLPMVLAAPPPAPVHVAPPPPAPEPARTPWWVFAVAGVTAALFVALVVWFVVTQA